jgi:hypothetical protein
MSHHGRRKIALPDGSAATDRTRFITFIIGLSEDGNSETATVLEKPELLNLIRGKILVTDYKTCASLGETTHWSHKNHFTIVSNGSCPVNCERTNIGTVCAKAINERTVVIGDSLLGKVLPMCSTVIVFYFGFLNPLSKHIDIEKLFESSGKSWQPKVLADHSKSHEPYYVIEYTPAPKVSQIKIDISVDLHPPPA